MLFLSGYCRSSSRLTPSTIDSSGRDLMSADMIREEQRLRWEREEMENLRGPVHYANVQFDGKSWNNQPCVLFDICVVPEFCFLVVLLYVLCLLYKKHTP